MINIIIYLVSVLIINLLIFKANYLPNYTGNKHQSFTDKKNVPLAGGIYVLIITFVLFYQKIDLLICSSIIFLIGFAGDKNYLISPKKRLILQILTVTLFVYLFNLLITNSRVEFLDNLLSISYFSFIFSIFCILVLINGSNFIDGLNGLLLGYSIIVLYAVFKIDLLNQIGFNQNDIYFLFFTLLFLLIINYFNFFFLGDSGSYLIGLILSFILISLYNLNSLTISPYFIILLLWYPCFENLFSIIRKIKKDISPINADNKHLHQLLFLFFEYKFNIKKNYLNPLISILINMFNFIIIYSASGHPSNTKYQVGYLIICILLYLILYLILNQKLKLILNKK